jgi:broad specificity phosphatase PhoE
LANNRPISTTLEDGMTVHIPTYAWRHAETTGNKGAPFTAAENPLLPLTPEGEVEAWGVGQLIESTYGPRYFEDALLAYPPTIRARATALRMYQGVINYREMKGGGPVSSIPICPVVLPGLREPDHGSDEWTQPKRGWDEVFPNTGDSVEKCFVRVEAAYPELVRRAIAQGKKRIVVVTSGHVCRLLAMTATGAGKDAWDTFANPDNCKGFRIAAANEIAAPILVGNGLAVESIGFTYEVR